MIRRHFYRFLGLALIVLTLTACDKPEEKAAKYLSRGDALMQQGAYDKARLEYKNAARLTPINPDVAYRLALVEEATGDLRNAFIDFLKIEQQAPHYGPALLKLAQYYQAAESVDEAQKRLSIVLQDDPDNAQAHALLGAQALRRKDLAEAESQVQRALQKDPANVTAFTVLTGLHMERKELPQALATLGKGIAQNPKEFSLYLLKAMLFETNGDWDGLTQTYREIFKLKPEAAQLRTDLAEMLKKAGRTEAAEQVLREAVAERPANKEMLRRLVLFIDETKGLEAAEAEIDAQKQTAEQEKKDAMDFWLADLYVRHKATPRATALLETIVTKKDAASDVGLTAQNALAKIRLAAGDRAAAERLVALVLEENPNNADALVLRASLAFQAGQYQKAVTDLRTVLRDKPKHARALQILAEALLAQGHLDLAADTLLQLVEASPSDPHAKIRLAQVLGLRGEADRALEILDLVTKTAPDKAVGWESVARVAIGAKKWPLAESAVQKLDGLDGQKQLAIFLRGQIKTAQNKPEEALPYDKEVVLADPAAPLAEYALAAFVNASRRLNKTEEAVAFIEALPIKTPYARTQLGQLYLTQGRPADAASQFSEAIEAGATFQDPYLNRASLYLAEKHSDEALAVLRKAVAAAPADLRAPMAMADILGVQKQNNAAIALYEDILARNPKADVAANNLAQLVADDPDASKEQLDKARIVAERFVSSDNPFFLDTLAWVYVRQDKLPQALTIMERVMTFGEKLPPQIRYHYGALLAKMGRPEQAKAELLKAVETNAPYPGLDEAKKLLQGL